MCFHFVTEFRHKHLLARTEAYKSAVGPSNKHFCPSPKKRIFPLNISPQKYMNRWNKSSWSIPMTFLLGGGGGRYHCTPIDCHKIYQPTHNILKCAGSCWHCSSHMTVEHSRSIHEAHIQLVLLSSSSTNKSQVLQ